MDGLCLASPFFVQHSFYSGGPKQLYLLTGVSFEEKLERPARFCRAAACSARGADRPRDLPTAPVNYPELHSDHPRRLLPQDALDVRTLKLSVKACVWRLWKSDFSDAVGAVRAAAASVATEPPSNRAARTADNVEQIASSGQMCVNRARFIPRAERCHVWCLTEAEGAL